MFKLQRISRKWVILINCLGLSCIGSALFLQGTVITGIMQNGYFRGIEQNPIILWFEAGLTIFGIAYFAYLFVRFIISHK